MAHRFEIRKNKRGEFVAYFIYNSETIWWTEGYKSKASAKNAIQSILGNGVNAEISDQTVSPEPELAEIQRKIDSTDWTGLGKAIGPSDQKRIRKRSKALLQAIIQSDADIQTKTDACKRVEAAVVLLGAPNVPWREVVSLLNHPAVTAFLATLNLLQLIIGFAS